MHWVSQKKILEAGMKAPSWDHYRNWQFIVLHERADKERTFAYAKAVAKRYVDENAKSIFDFMLAMFHLKKAVFLFDIHQKYICRYN